MKKSIKKHLKGLLVMGVDELYMIHYALGEAIVNTHNAISMEPKERRELYDGHIQLLEDCRTMIMDAIDASKGESSERKKKFK